MASTQRKFPTNICPTGRTYKPGRLPETSFEARNGAVSFVQYGQNFVNAELTLDFANINDAVAGQILQHYESVRGDDYVVFGKDAGLQGLNQSLIDEQVVQNGKNLLRWRYSAAPQLTSVYPGVSTVQVQFVGVLYGS
jgi:hypothetical protein